MKTSVSAGLIALLRKRIGECTAAKLDFEADQLTQILWRAELLTYRPPKKAKAADRAFTKMESELRRVLGIRQKEDQRGNHQDKDCRWYKFGEGYLVDQPLQQLQTEAEAGPRQAT